MTPGLTSVVIPSYNHAAYLADAIDSALAQTAPVDVIVIDDGSTDQTATVLYPYAGRIRKAHLPHGGPSLARNAGIDAAHGEFVMFLDADDVIAPTKVARQIEAFSDDVGWVICDVRIEDEERRRVTTASERYGYAGRGLGGWIRQHLTDANFIPLMSPLIRRSVLTEDVRFPDRDREDWHFLYRLAAHARVRYLPEVLATYRKRRGSRNTVPAVDLPPAAADGPLLLNLGCGTPGTRSWHPMPDSVNLDRSMGWIFEDGLTQFADGSVAGITISHALMYLEACDWPAFMAEAFRVLAPGGVIRITEDDAINPASSRCGGWKGSEPAVTKTSPMFVRAHLGRAGFTVHDVDAETTRYRDRSLIQAQHGAPPDVFFIEGIKP